MLDTIRQVETPEGVELTLPVAGPVARAQAWIVDLLFKVVILWIGWIALAVLGRTGMGLYLIFYFIVTWLYPVLFEAGNNGATPGKRLLGLRVVHDDGTPVGWPAAFIRSIVGFADSLPGVYGVGLLSTLFHRDFKRLGDIAAGTLVVHVQRKRRGAWKSETAPAPPPVALLPEEQRAIVDFAERSRLLTAGRRAELADIAAGLTRGSRDRSEQLQAQASWIAGHR